MIYVHILYRKYKYNMMNLKKLKNYLISNIYGSDGKISTGKFKSLPVEVKDSIFHFTSNCQSNKFSERIYWVLNDLHDYPVKCKHPDCNKPLRFKGEYQGVFCSYSCNSKYQLLVSPNPFSGPSGIQRRKDGMIRKYGVDHNMKTKNSLAKRQETYIKNYGVYHPLKSKEIIDIVRKKNEDAGRWTPENQMEEFYLYRRKVWRHTNQQPIETLPNYDLRGHARDKTAYSLDHRFSCHEGFKNNIPPEIIGNIANLEYIPNTKNSSKKDHCSITKEELYTSYNKNTKESDDVVDDIDSGTRKQSPRHSGKGEPRVYDATTLPTDIRNT